MKKMKLMIISICVAMLLLHSLSGCSVSHKEHGVFSDAVVTDDNYNTYYEIYVGSFADSDKDGVGDLRGIIEQLDYLNDGDPKTMDDLGITGIWLMPIFTSPTYHKYDASNYMEIDPAYGTMDDLQDLIDGCHDRGIKLIIDLVLNHCSTEHEWFVKAKAGDPDYVDYFCYSDSPQSGYESFGNGKYYECQFWGGMPDLNFDNEDLRQELVDIATHYLKMGLDGFRLDAVKYFYYNSTGENVDVLTWFREECEKVNPNTYLIGECWSDDTEILSYSSSGVSHFNFGTYGTSGKIYTSVSYPEKYFTYTETWQTKLNALNSGVIDSAFIANHDNNRAGGFLTGDNAKKAASLYILAPGNPYIYYGEEIGMKGSGVDENKRTSMLWGKSSITTDNWIGSGVTNQIDSSVKDQDKDVDSLLNHYRRVIRLRESHPEIARGVLEYVESGIPGVGIAKITYDGKTVYVVHNFTDSAQTVSVSGDNVDYVSIYSGNMASIANGSLSLGSGVSAVIY